MQKADPAVQLDDAFKAYLLLTSLTALEQLLRCSELVHSN